MTALSCVEVEEWLLTRASDAELRLTPEGELHVSTCLHCRELMSTLTRLRGAMSTAPVLPSPALGAKLLERIRGDDRFGDLAPEVAHMFDIPEPDAHVLLRQLGDDAAWVEGPAPGVRIMPIEGGPRIAGAFAGFVRMAPGAAYPAHLHRGTEQNLVLQGGFREDDGEETWAGEWCNKTDGSCHGFVAVEGPDCIAAAVILGEVDFLTGPGDA